MVITPIFEICNPIGSLFYTSLLIDSLFLLKKICLSVSHSVPQILGPNIGLNFHQNVLFNCF